LTNDAARVNGVVAGVRQGECMMADTWDELMRAVLLAPGEDSARLRLADSLVARGDPRGEFKLKEQSQLLTAFFLRANRPRFTDRQDRIAADRRADNVAWTRHRLPGDSVVHVRHPLGCYQVISMV